MKKCQSLFYVLAVTIIIASFAADAISQRKGRTNRPSAPASAKVLSRTVAADLIKKDVKFRRSYDADVPVGRFWYRGSSNDVRYQFDNIQPLEERGILTLTEKSSRPGWIEYVVQLTAEGEEAAKSWSRGTDEEMFTHLYGMAAYGLPANPEGAFFGIPLAVRQVVEVTGIAFDSSHTRAQVEFTWKWLPTTQAKLLPSKAPTTAIYSEAVPCTLYDDGWRCAFHPYEMKL